MEKQTVDRRVLKTKKQLRQGLAQLMRQKNINRITVKELAELVDINRATFYAHYKDVYDLVEEVESEIAQKFQQMLDNYDIDRQLLDIRPLMVDIFEFIGDNAELASALMGSHGDIAFVRRIQNMVGDYIIHYWQKFNPADTAGIGLYSCTFVVSGGTGLMQRWLDDGMPQTPGQMAEIAARLVRNGLFNFSADRG